MKFTKYLLFLFLATQGFALDILVPKAPPAIPAIKAAQEMEGVNIYYFTDTVTEVVPKIMQNKEYVFVVPTNLAAKLNNKGKDLRVLGITTKGILSVISTEELSNIDGLSGKDIYVGGQGSSPDVITQYILKKNHVDAHMKYRTSPEVAKLIMTEKINYAVLPEPLATMALFKNKNLKRAFIYKNEWEKINNNQGIPQVGFFASQKVINTNQAEIKAFLAAYKDAVAWVNENPADAAELGKNALMLPMPAKVIENAIPNMNLIFQTPAEAKISINNYLKNLMEINTKILSKLPKDDFYEN